MFYEEKFIDGILFIRTSPDEEFRQAGVDVLNQVILDLKNEIRQLYEELEKYQSEESESPGS